MIIHSIDKIGFGSIAASGMVLSAEAADLIELSNSWVIDYWTMGDWALLVSIISGLSFLASNIYNIHLARKNDKINKKGNKKDE